MIKKTEMGIEEDKSEEDEEKRMKITEQRVYKEDYQKRG